MGSPCDVEKPWIRVMSCPPRLLLLLGNQAHQPQAHGSLARPDHARRLRSRRPADAAARRRVVERRERAPDLASRVATSPVGPQLGADGRPQALAQQPCPRGRDEGVSAHGTGGTARRACGGGISAAAAVLAAAWAGFFGEGEGRRRQPLQRVGQVSQERRLGWLHFDRVVRQQRALE